MLIQIGFSPCPNDTFIFDAMLHGKVDTEGLTFAPVIEDVEYLNRVAFAGDIAVTKLSYHAFAHLTHQFRLLNAGSALGTGCGPLLVAASHLPLADVEKGNIAIPGKMTTANLLLSLALPEAKDKKEVLFSDIEDAILRKEVTAGLIIHENRFTYERKGLVKLLDLGEYWEQTTGLPIPLGGIVVNRNLPLDLQQKIDRVMRRSVEYAFAHISDVMPFVREHAQAMEDEVMQAHIDLYVTHYTVDLGIDGRAAVQYLLETAVEKGVIGHFEQDFLI